ncbi:MAG: anti-sigma factor [Terriglobales bacterium]
MSGHDEFRNDLPLFAAGALAEGEADAVQRHVDSCGECEQELADLVNAAAQIAISRGGAKPGAHLRERILRDANRGGLVAKARPDGWLPSGLRPHLPGGWVWAPMFAAILFAVLTVTNWKTAQQLKEENATLTLKSSENAKLLERTRALVETLTAPDAVHFTLTASGKPAPPEAKAIYSEKQRALVLTANNLPSLQPNQAYQLWLLPRNTAAPIPYGTFKPDQRGNGVLIMTALEPTSVKGFAVTIEPESGSQQPTTAIVLVGTI